MSETPESRLPGTAAPQAHELPPLAAEGASVAADGAGAAREDGRSVLRAIAVLEYVASRSGGSAPGVVEIARALGREKSAVSRNLRTLTQAGLLARDPVQLGYRIGGRLYRIAASTRDARLIELGEQQIGALTDRFGERAEVCERTGNLATTIATASPDSPLQVVGWVGRPHPLASTAAGRALLFDARDDDVRRLVETAGIGGAGPHAPHSADDVLERLAADRESGVSLSLEESDRGLASIAAPVRTAHGRVVAAITVSAPLERLRGRLDDISHALLDSARAIAEQLGASPAAGSPGARAEAGLGPDSTVEPPASATAEPLPSPDVELLASPAVEPTGRLGQPESTPTTAPDADEPWR